MQKIKLPLVRLPNIALFKEFILKLPFVEKWKFAKRYINMVIPLLCLTAIGTITIAASSPFMIEFIQFTQRINSLDRDIKSYKNRLEMAKLLNKEKLQRQMDLLNRKFSPNISMSYILDTFAELGSNLGIKFITINPSSMVEYSYPVGNFDYTFQVLPIEIYLESEYADFGVFMDRLSQLPDCQILIKGYSLSKTENILPRLSVKLELEVYILKNGKKHPVAE